jgi:G3E family GTPase
VYARRTPFHPQKLAALVKQLPVTIQHTLALQGGLDNAHTHESATDRQGPLSTVIRSKGFAWLATHHTAAVYWSHAGDHFELKNVGTWWACANPADLPGGKLPPAVQADFEGEYGDRRQEIVFIGVGMDTMTITASLDECLLHPDEFAKYHEHFMVSGAPASEVTDGALDART